MIKINLYNYEQELANINIKLLAEMITVEEYNNLIEDLNYKYELKPEDAEAYNKIVQIHEQMDKYSDMLSKLNKYTEDYYKTKIEVNKWWEKNKEKYNKLWNQIES